MSSLHNSVNSFAWVLIPASYRSAAAIPMPPFSRSGHWPPSSEEAIARNGQLSLQYTVSNGIPRLREQIAQRMGLDGIKCTPEEVLILQGGQQGLDLTAKLLIDRGDIIVTENPTFLGGLIAFNPDGAALCHGPHR